MHGGLLQPLLLSGFNAAFDVRHRRLVASYSHGEGLDLSRFSLTPEQRRQGARVSMPWTTGFGVGATFVDELYGLIDLKAHRVQVDSGAEARAYTTLTVGAEVGYRAFLGEIFFLTPVVRWWPTVHSTEGPFTLAGPAGPLEHSPLPQGADGWFVNLLVGAAFDVRGRRRTGLSRPCAATRASAAPDRCR